MSNTFRFLWFPAVIVATVLLSRRWPEAMRRDSRLLAAINGVAVLCLIATGLLPRIAPVAAIHRWLPHGLLIVDWTAIPFAIGEILVRFRARPLAAAARSRGCSCSWLSYSWLRSPATWARLTDRSTP